jgi:hypothetical protein
MISLKDYLDNTKKTGCKHQTDSLHFYGKRIRDCESCGRWWVKDGLKWRDPTEEEFFNVMARGDMDALCL